jgi:hypothetical protein
MSQSQTGADMTPRILDDISTWFVDWSLITIMGNTMPPRDPDDDDDEDEEDGQDEEDGENGEGEGDGEDEEDEEDEDQHEEPPVVRETRRIARTRL